MTEFAGKRVYVAGHRGMVGGAIVRRLSGEGCTILTAGRDEVDLRDPAATSAWMARRTQPALRALPQGRVTVAACMRRPTRGGGLGLPGAAATRP